MKELLDLLEKRVTALIDEVRDLRQENAQLKQDLINKTDSLAEENATLRDTLAQEQNARETAASRIDALLQRLTEHTAQ